MLRNGWQMDTVSRTAGIAESNAPAATGDRIGGWLLVTAVQASDLLTALLGAFLLIASGLAVLRTVLVLVATWVHVRRTRRRPQWPVDEPVTGSVPAYNEKK